MSDLCAALDSCKGSHCSQRHNGSMLSQTSALEIPWWPHCFTAMSRSCPLIQVYALHAGGAGAAPVQHRCTPHLLSEAAAALCAQCIESQGRCRLPGCLAAVVLAGHAIPRTCPPSEITPPRQVSLTLAKPVCAGYGYFRPNIRLFDPGWKGPQMKGPEDESVPAMDNGNDPAGLIRR